MRSRVYWLGRWDMSCSPEKVTQPLCQHAGDIALIERRRSYSTDFAEAACPGFRPGVSALNLGRGVRQTHLRG